MKFHSNIHIITWNKIITVCLICMNVRFLLDLKLFCIFFIKQLQVAVESETKKQKAIKVTNESTFAHIDEVSTCTCLYKSVYNWKVLLAGNITDTTFCSQWIPYIGRKHYYSMFKYGTKSQYFKRYDSYTIFCLCLRNVSSRKILESETDNFIHSLAFIAAF